MTTLSDLGLTAATPDDVLLAAHDRLEAMTELQARIVAAYYNGLRNGGLPMELCEHLTREWHAWQPKGRFWLTQAHQEQTTP